MFKAPAVYNANSTQVSPSPKDACFQKGEEYYNSGDYAMAVVMYTATLVFEPENDLYKISKNLAEAKSSSSSNTEYIANYIANLNNDKGDIFVNLKKYQEALRCYNEAVTLAPSHSTFHHNKGKVLSTLKRYQEADESFGIAITLEPENPVLYHNKGFNLAELPDHKGEAITSLIRATLLYGTSQYAVRCYDKIIELHPQHAYAYCNKGNILYAEGKYQEALNCYDATISISALGYAKTSSYASSAQTIDAPQKQYHYVDAYIGKSKILAAQRELKTNSAKFTKILAIVYENKLYMELGSILFDSMSEEIKPIDYNKISNLILGYATGADKEFLPLTASQEQITNVAIEIALTGVIDS